MSDLIERMRLLAGNTDLYALIGLRNTKNIMDLCDALEQAYFEIKKLREGLEQRNETKTKAIHEIDFLRERIGQLEAALNPSVTTTAKFCGICNTEYAGEHYCAGAKGFSNLPSGA